MAATNAVIGSAKFIARGVVLMQWQSTGVSGHGNPLDAANLPDKSVEILGVTGGTSEVFIEGSNATTPTGTYQTLKSLGGTVLQFTTTAVEVIGENMRWIRPRFGTATGPTIDVRVVARGGFA